KNRYLYNDGSERIDDLDLGVDMTKFRVLDPAIGRWWQVDPKADFESLVSWTPYNSMLNNPINYNDPLGDMPASDCPPGEKCRENYFVKVAKMMAEDLSNDVKAVKAAVSEWAKGVPILGNLTGDGEKVKGDRLHLTT